MGKGELDMQVISVFGSSKPRPGSTQFAEAFEVGRLLAEHGLAVATGGYGGTMAAVSQGAADAGGHVIGVTSKVIEQFRQAQPNPWIREEIKYDSLWDRLNHLVRHNAGMIVLPGGIGTMSEMALAWSFLQVGEIGPRPLSLLGNIWQDTLKTFFDPLNIKEADMELLYFATSAETAVSYITKTLPEANNNQ
jgi:uncharacterized protein (TIGR00730 family)